MSLTSNGVAVTVSTLVTTIVITLCVKIGNISFYDSFKIGAVMMVCCYIIIYFVLEKTVFKELKTLYQQIISLEDEKKRP